MKTVRRALVTLLILLITMPCIFSATAATRFTGYINKNTYVYKKPSKSSKKTKITLNTKVYVIGKSGKFYKVQNTKNKVKGYVLKSCVSKKKVTPTPIPGDDPDDPVDPTDPDETDPSTWKSRVVKLDWYKTGKNVLRKGGYGYIYDITTGIRLRVKRMGGTNHADIEPATASDTAKLKKIAGGRFSWTCHAVILQASGQYVACSINTMPHGDQTIMDNNYDGQFCLHMVNSRTHGTDTINPNHQACIRKAYNWAHNK